MQVDSTTLPSNRSLDDIGGSQPTSFTRQLHSPVASWVAALFTALYSLYNYYPTIQPGVGPFLDSVEFQTTSALFGVSHPPGYPLYSLLGGIFTRLPLSMLQLAGAHGDNPAWRLNFMNALVAAITVMLVVRLVYRLTHNVGAGLFAGLLLGGAVRFWFQATYAEVYPLYNLLLIATLLMLIGWQQTQQPRFYYGSVLTLSLAFGVQLSAFLLILGWLWFVWVVDRRILLRWRSLLWTSVIVVLAAALYLYIPLRSFVGQSAEFCNYCPADWSEVVGFITGRSWGQLGLAFAVHPQFYLQRWADSGYQLALSIWPSGIMLGAIGLWYLLRDRWRVGILFLLMLVTSWFFVISADIVDWSDFITPVIVLFAPLIGVGLWIIWELFKRRSSTWPDTFKIALRPLIMFLLLLMPVILSYATFQNNRPLVDQSGNMIWHWTARDLLKQFEDDALLLAPFPGTDGFAVSWAIRYVAWTENLHPEMQLVWPSIDEDPPGPAPGYVRWDAVQDQLRERPVYLIERNDDRIGRFILLPILRDDGWTIGYQVVGEQTDEGVDVWVSAEKWQTIESQLIYP